MAISNPKLWPNIFCYQGDYHEIPETAASDSGLFSFAEGFPPITATPLKAGGVAPNREDFNGFLRLISENILFLQQGGFYLYDATVTYKQNAVVMYDGSLYQSLADDNVGNQPGTSSAQWKPFIPNAEVASYLTSLTLLSRICDKINASSNTPAENPTPAQIETALTAILASISSMGKLNAGNTWAKKQTLTLGASAGSGYTPTNNADLTTKKYVDDELDKVTGNIAFKDEANTFTEPQTFQDTISALSAAFANESTGKTPATTDNSTKLATTAFVRACIDQFAVPVAAPPGTIVAYAGTTVPSGWLTCNGANVSRTTYANLFAKIGTKWGAGDGSTTFGLPDGRNRTLWGANAASNVGSYLSAGLPNITGAVNHIKTRAPLASVTATYAFTRSGSNVLSADSGTVDAEIVFNFSAKNSNSHYKDGQKTVNVNSYQILMIIKT